MNAEYDPRMRRETPHPRWWMLYLIVLGAAAALWLEARARMTAGDHEAALIVLLLGVGALINIWLSANTVPLLDRSPREELTRTIEYRDTFVLTHWCGLPAPDEVPVTGAIVQSIESGTDDGARVPLPAPALTRSEGE
jgi:hypothetical protein